MLELAVLGLLKERAMHGYELKRQLGARLGFFWKVSFGSLYPTLKKLEARGLLERVADTDVRPRRRQVYRITEQGEQEFHNLISEGANSSWEEEKFPLRFAFFSYLSSDTRIWLLQRRRDYLEDKLMEGEQALNRARRGRSDTYTMSLMRHGVATTQHDIDWIDELLAAERAAVPTSPVQNTDFAGAPASEDDRSPAAEARDEPEDETTESSQDRVPAVARTTAPASGGADNPAPQTKETLS